MPIIARMHGNRFDLSSTGGLSMFRSGVEGMFAHIDNSLRSFSIEFIEFVTEAWISFVKNSEESPFSFGPAPRHSLISERRGSLGRIGWHNFRQDSNDYGYGHLTGQQRFNRRFRVFSGQIRSTFPRIKRVLNDSITRRMIRITGFDEILLGTYWGY